MKHFARREEKLPPWVFKLKVYMRVVAVALLVSTLVMTYMALVELRNANATLQWTNQNYHMMVKHQNDVIKAMQTDRPLRIDCDGLNLS